jgi:hypothetical protein
VVNEEDDIWVPCVIGCQNVFESHNLGTTGVERKKYVVAK